MMEENRGLFFCPPKLTTEYRLWVWNLADLIIGVLMVTLGFLWLGVIVITAGAFFLLLKAYITEDKSIYTVIKAIIVYFTNAKAFSQYKDKEQEGQQ